MKFYIKRDKTVDDSLFIVFDENGKEKYFVTGTKDKMIVKDSFDNIIMVIRYICFSKIKTFSIRHKNNNIKFIIANKKSSSSCYYYGICWRIRGDVFKGSFDIVDADNTVVATIGRDFSKFGSNYGLTINHTEMEMFCIGTALCVNVESKVDNTLLQTV